MAWSINADLCGVQTFSFSKIVTIALVSDGSAQSAELNLFNLIPWDIQAYLQTGGFVYAIFSTPDETSPPASAFTLVLTDKCGSKITLPSQDHTAANPVVAGDFTNTGVYFMLHKVINFTTTYAGTSGDTVLVSFVIL